MNNKRPKHILLNSSGCLTQMACRHYVQNKLNEEHLAFVNEHLQSCDLCRDAMEGYGIVLPPKVAEEEFNNTLSSLENNIDQITQEHKKANQGKQKRLIYFTGLAASVVIGLAVMVTMRYDDFFNKNALAENSAEKIPIDQLNIELAAYEGHFNAPVLEQSDASQTNFTPTNNEQSSYNENEINNLSTTNSAKDNDETEFTESSMEVLNREEVVELGTEMEARSEAVQLNQDFTKSEPSQGLNISASVEEESSTSISIDNDESDQQTRARFRNIPGIEEFKNYISEEYQSVDNNEISSSSLNGVKVVAVVNENGVMKNVEILNTINADQEKIIRDIILKSPSWQPATTSGKPIKQTIEISFEGSDTPAN